MPERPPPDACAHCGAALSRHAKACPACGADERTGWREQSVYDGIDLPDEAWAEEASFRRPAAPRRINGLAWYWWCVAAAILASLTLAMLRW